jgi:hypothetical protein
MNAPNFSMQWQPSHIGRTLSLRFSVKKVFGFRITLGRKLSYGLLTKNRLGISANVNMLFNLGHLITARENLEALSAPITRDEIDNVVKRLRLDKALGPDGFNGLFAKRCRTIINNDFYKLCEDFFEGLIV